MKQNIGQKVALYPTPATVVGTIDAEGKINFMLLAHIGIVSHSKILISMHSVHQSDKAIQATKKFSINMIDESFVAQADYAGTVSGAKVDKSGLFEYHLGEAGTPVKGKPDYEKLKPVLFEMPTYKYLRTGEVIGDCVKMGKAYAAEAGI